MLKWQLNALLALIFAGGCVIQDYSSEQGRLALLSAEANYPGVNDELANVKWTKGSDPQLLTIYCSARFALWPQESSCMLARESSPETISFAEGLWHTWSGRTKAARVLFDGLLDDKQWGVWGAIGHLELAQHTENYQKSVELLRKFEAGPLRVDLRFERAFRKYQLSYVEATSNWEALEQNLQTYSQTEITRDPDVFAAQSRLLFIQYKKAELGELLQDAAANLERTTIYKFRKADHLVLVNGIPESKALIIDTAKLHPGDPNLVIEQAYIELLSDSPVVAQAAWQRLYQSARSSPNNVRLLLDMATTLASYHKAEESSQVFDLINTKDSTLGDFTVFHVLSAWGSVYRGDISQARRNLSTALDLAPQHLAANWLKALIAKRLDDPKMGAEALAVLFAADPYNKNYRNLIRHFRGKYKTPELEQLYQEVLKRERLEQK